ncbi:MAG TPA: hypothetical protein VMU17_04360, partial [Elusimicrobiota bacterium]|nr:hypothetical protein [Elusimicrobiota bacterium]
FESHVSWTASAPITSVTQDGKLMPMSYPLPATNAYFNSVGLDPTLSHTYVFTVAGPPNMICSSVWQVKAYSQAAINAGGVVIDTPAPYGSTIFISAYGVFQPKESIFTTCGLQTTNAFPGTAQINLSFPSTEVSRGESCGFYIPGQSPVFATF